MTLPEAHDFFLLPLSEIYVDRETRQRRVIDTSGLKESIAKYGVLQPIIVARAGPPHKLIAGERRFTTAQELEFLHISVRFFDSLSETEIQIVELEENVKRKDLTWQEVVVSSKKIHQLYLTQDEGWTQVETADALSVTPGTLSLYLRVADHMEDERISKATSAREAYNILSRRDAREAGNALQEMLETPTPTQEQLEAVYRGESIPASVAGAEGPPSPPPARRDPAKSILHESFLQWAPRYSGKPFNLIHCDFPYGIKVFSGPQGNTSNDSSAYDDSQDVYFTLLDSLCDNLDKIMAVSGHLLFWYSEKHRDRTMATFRTKAPDLIFQPYPLIWVKTDNVGIAANPTQGPRHIYETCLMATRRSRQIVRIVGDAYSAPTDKRHHISCKPEPMLKHFMQMLVDEHSRVLDPTCGSGSALRAAETLGATEVLGLEIDEANCGMARMLLGQARALRGAP